MTIQHAHHANPDGTAVVVATDEAGDVFIDLESPEASGPWAEVFTQWLAEGNTPEPYQAPLDPEALRAELYGKFLTLPAQVRGMFLPQWAAVNTAFDFNDMEAAVACIEMVTVPPELESFKAELLEILRRAL
jgi:hypothetical protein